MRFEVLMAVKMSMVVFCVVMSYGLVGLKCPENAGSMFLQNVGTHLQVHDITT
jgi:hypothetical protein